VSVNGLETEYERFRIRNEARAARFKAKRNPSNKVDCFLQLITKAQKLNVNRGVKLVRDFLLRRAKITALREARQKAAISLSSIKKERRTNLPFMDMPKISRRKKWERTAKKGKLYADSA